MVQQYDDLRGATVTRMVTYAEFLDEMPDGTGAVVANPSADPTAVVRREVFQIDQKESIDNVAATFLCVAPVDVEGAMLPRRIVRKRWCDAMYRVYDADSGVFIYFAQADGGCPWGNTTPDGGKYFDEFDNPTTIDKDKCSKRLQGCYKRFGFTNTAGNLVTNVTLPAQMFPGVLATQEAG
jgi:lambda family phage minor tail protein L